MDQERLIRAIKRMQSDLRLYIEVRRFDGVEDSKGVRLTAYGIADELGSAYELTPRWHQTPATPSEGSKT